MGKSQVFRNRIVCGLAFLWYCACIGASAFSYAPEGWDIYDINYRAGMLLISLFWALGWQSKCIKYVSWLVVADSIMEILILPMPVRFEVVTNTILCMGIGLIYLSYARD